MQLKLSFIKPCVYVARNQSEISDGERIDQTHLNNSANW